MMLLLRVTVPLGAPVAVKHVISIPVRKPAHARSSDAIADGQVLEKESATSGAAFPVAFWVLNAGQPASALTWAW